MEYTLPSQRNVDTIKRFMQEDKFFELEQMCELDSTLKQKINIAIIEFELFQDIDSEEHPMVINLQDMRDEVRERIRMIMRNRFASNHPINQVFDYDGWTGKVLMKSLIDFSDPSNWE